MTICARCGGELVKEPAPPHDCIMVLTDRVTFLRGYVNGLASRIEIAHGAVTSLRSELAAHRAEHCCGREHAMEVSDVRRIVEYMRAHAVQPWDDGFYRIDERGNPVPQPKEGS